MNPEGEHMATVRCILEANGSNTGIIALMAVAVVAFLGLVIWQLMRHLRKDARTGSTTVPAVFIAHRLQTGLNM